jgi:hypothetical protein
MHCTKQAATKDSRSSGLVPSAGPTASKGNLGAVVVGKSGQGVKAQQTKSKCDNENLASKP